MDTFTCSRCKLTKPLSEFYANKSKRGHITVCKVCMQIASHHWKKANKATVLLHGKTYRETHSDDLLVSNRITSKHYRERHPEKRRESQQGYYARNHDVILVKNRAHSRKYRETHLEECIENAREWREANPEKVAASFKAYRINNIENFQVYVERRRAREKSAARRDFTTKQWRIMLVLSDYCCCYCGRQMKRLTIEHLKPFEKHGDDTLWNILPACKSCNSRKHIGPVLCPVQPFLLLPNKAPERLPETQADVYAPTIVVPDTQLPLL